MCFALVQTYLRATLHVDVQQPVDDEQRLFDPADFAQCYRKLMLSGVPYALGYSLPHTLRCSPKASALTVWFL